MDPKEALRRARELSQMILCGATMTSDEIVELATAVDSLDKWMRDGGFSPWD